MYIEYSLSFFTIYPQNLNTCYYVSHFKVWLGGEF